MRLAANVAPGVKPPFLTEKDKVLADKIRSLGKTPMWLGKEPQFEVQPGVECGECYEP